VYAGQTAFATADAEDTLDDPLAKDVGQEGARFGSGMRRQTFEPTPLGFAIQDAGGADQSNARQYDIDRAAWEAAGGRTAGTSVDSGDRDAAAVFDRVTLGELSLGSGQVRIAGALLPQPTQEFDHTLGLEPFATTYTGYIVLCNLVECTVRSEGGGGEPPPAPGPGPGTDGGDTGPAAGGGAGSAGGACSNRIEGSAEGEKLSGGDGSDRIVGRRGDDRLAGRGGNDCLLGGGGKDGVRGGAGKDELRGGKGADAIKGGGGRDTVRAARGGRDRIDCGGGRDRAFVNERLDRTRRCEKLIAR
jgi:hypothetical protein